MVFVLTAEQVAGLSVYVDRGDLDRPRTATRIRNKLIHDGSAYEFSVNDDLEVEFESPLNTEEDHYAHFDTGFVFALGFKIINRIASKILPERFSKERTEEFFKLFESIRNSAEKSKDNFSPEIWAQLVRGEYDLSKQNDKDSSRSAD